MNIYRKKRIWKWLLFAFAALIATATLVYSNLVVQQIAEEERSKVKIWADAIQRKADLVNYTEEFFRTLRAEERKKVEWWAEATQRSISADDEEDLTFYSDIITGNTTIPVILTDEEGNINAAVNVDFDKSKHQKLEGWLKEQYSLYPPIAIDLLGTTNYIYYKDSKLFSELKVVLDDLIESFFTEIVVNSGSVPVIITDEDQKKVIAFGNLDSLSMKDSAFVHKKIQGMRSQNQPLEIDISGQKMRYIFYEDSLLLTRLTYYPLILLIIIGVFLFVAYLLFSTSRNSEQNQVWVGMAKETAHQLGTPLSSMIGWLELMKLQGIDNEATNELRKDIVRLEAITERFSKIGSPPQLDRKDLILCLQNCIDYLKSRTSKNVKYQFETDSFDELLIPLNCQLFSWVIENLCKNAIDAMGNEGEIQFLLTEENKQIIIDVSDTGKGLSRSQYKSIFSPGYTTKKRGWGLGLSLSARIIREYHKGKIFVKTSIPGKGTTFRIILPK